MLVFLGCLLLKKFCVCRVFISSSVVFMVDSL